jgi:endonuclease VIII
MPEGHTVHRTARHFREHFAGQFVEVSSPQGRFSDAALITGSKLLGAQAIGKQLFLEFEPAVLRIHLGIYGKWLFQEVLDQTPEPVGAVRARFRALHNVADVRGPNACQLIDQKAYEALIERLGPDPLRPDPESLSERKFVTNVLGSQRPIGVLLMDQNIVAGIGNVYRAELLFRAGLDPYRPGKSHSIEQISALWQDAVHLMEIGAKTGIMLTREGHLRPKTSLEERYYVYKREGLSCRNCDSTVAIGLMATRKLYWCPGCQP